MVVTYRDRLDQNDIDYRIGRIEDKWGVGEEFVFGIVTRENYNRIMLPVGRVAKRDFKRNLGYGDVCVAHLEEMGYVAQYLQGGTETDMLRSRMMIRSKGLGLKSEERQVEVHRPGRIIVDVPKEIIVPEGEFEAYLLGQIGIDAFIDYRAGEMDDGLADEVADIRTMFYVPRRHKARQFYRDDRASFIS